MKTDELSPLDISFNSLYVSLPYTKVHCFDDSMLYYNVPFGHAESMTKEINEKIKELNLPLIAKSNARNGIFKDSIIIEPINK